MRNWWKKFCLRCGVVRLWPLPFRLCWVDVWALMRIERGPAFGIEISWTYRCVFSTWK